MKQWCWGLVFFAWTVTAGWAGSADIGVVLLHGKWGGPKAPVMMAVADGLTGKGYQVSNIQMPWSRNRQYDKDYSEAVEEIDAAVKELKAKGTKLVFVAGQSFGANAALAYAAERDGAVGIALLGPGHTPDYQESFFATSVAKARDMVKDGKGEEVSGFDDNNQGQTRTIQTKARVYLSYFDPKGLGAMSVTAPRVRAGTAVFLVIAYNDPWYSRAKSVIFEKVPVHPQSRYEQINSNHMNTPKDGLPQLLEWLAQFE